MSQTVSKPGYYVPHRSTWSIVGSIGLFIMMLGAARWLHHDFIGKQTFLVGVGIIIFMMFRWFAVVIHESLNGQYSTQVDRSFRWGMIWFIFSEVFFFIILFGALFYARICSVPWLSGQGHGFFTGYLIWPDFQAHWPLLKNPDPGQFKAPKEVMETWGLPALNTLILLTSGATITWAHWALLKDKRKQLLTGLSLTVLLGVLFLVFQVHEYGIAYAEKGLTFASGIYGTTFFMLTGFHGLHVTIGTIMLIVVLIRSFKGHFNSQHHFAFEAVSWYWHFVDVVWLGLFLFVYWL